MFTEIILLKKEMHLIKTFLTLLISLYIFFNFSHSLLKAPFGWSTGGRNFHEEVEHALYESINKELFFVALSHLYLKYLIEGGLSFRYSVRCSSSFSEPEAWQLGDLSA